MDLGLHLERASDTHLLRQVCDALRTAILRGSLPAGARLPSSRALAAELGVSRNLVVEAFEELGADGYLTSRHGSGTYVVEDLALPGDPPRRDSLRSDRWRRPLPSLPSATSDDLSIDFRLGQPSLERFSPDTWRSHVARCRLRRAAQLLPRSCRRARPARGGRPASRHGARDRLHRRRRGRDRRGDSGVRPGRARRPRARGDGGVRRSPVTRPRGARCKRSARGCCR